MLNKLCATLFLCGMSFAASAQITGKMENHQGEFKFSYQNQQITLTSERCQAFLASGKTAKNVKIDGLNDDLEQQGQLKATFENGQSCVLDDLTPPVAMTMPPVMAMPPIHAQDTMSRQFTMGVADLMPVHASTRPSAVILLSQGTNAKKANTALCNSFVKLETVEEATENQGVAETAQVVTKVPVTVELQQNNDDCEEILAVYDYKLAAEELTQLNPKLLRSNGPFIAIYNPNSVEINQIIDLNGASEADIKKFGQNWHTIFTEYAMKQTRTVQTNAVVESEKTSIWMTLKGLFKSSVCSTDPNLIYIFDDAAGKIADYICKSKA